MAANPNRSPGRSPLSLSILKNGPELFTSGGSTGIPSLEHSLMELIIRSGLSSREFSTDAIYSTG